MMRKNFLEGRLLKDIPHMVRYRKMFYRVDLGKCYLIMNYYNFPKLSTKGDYSEEVSDLLSIGFEDYCETGANWA